MHALPRLIRQLNGDKIDVVVASLSRDALDFPVGKQNLAVNVGKRCLFQNRFSFGTKFIKAETDKKRRVVASNPTIFKS